MKDPSPSVNPINHNLNKSSFNINISRVVSEELKPESGKFPANCPSFWIFPNKIYLSGPKLQTGYSRI
jgi:hypothetical protein